MTLLAERKRRTAAIQSDKVGALLSVQTQKGLLIKQPFFAPAHP
ncbi:hypothetical protein QNH99_00175 [Pantoea allii]|nr:MULTISPECIES: hypothetical protein [Pantoea]MDJ0089683.1 hypothetical protein [Pantoea allii]